MLVNKAVNAMIQAGKKVHLTPAEIKAKDQIMKNLTIKAELQQGAMEELTQELINPDMLGYFLKLGQMLPTEKLNAMSSKMQKLGSDLLALNEKGFTNETERFLASKKVRTELKRAFRNDEQSQVFLKEIKAMLEDEKIKKPLEKISDFVTDKMGLNTSYEEMAYNLGTSGKEWDYAMKQKAIYKKPVEMIKGFVDYFIKK